MPPPVILCSHYYTIWHTIWHFVLQYAHNASQNYKLLTCGCWTVLRQSLHHSHPIIIFFVKMHFRMKRKTLVSAEMVGFLICKWQYSWCVRSGTVNVWFHPSWAEGKSTRIILVQSKGLLSSKGLYWHLDLFVGDNNNNNNDYWNDNNLLCVLYDLVWTEYCV